MDRSFIRSFVAAGLAATAASMSTMGHAATISVVTPPALEASPGNAQGPAPFRFFGDGGSRSQVAYSASFFQGPIEIREVLFRPYPGFSPSGFFGGALDVSNVTIQLSTTARLDETGTPLSSTFATNIGADVRTVYSGQLSLVTAGTGTPVRDFDYRIVLQTPFAYDPTQGNLLLDVAIPVGATVSGQGFGFGTFDNVNSFNDGVYSVVEVNAGGTLTGFAATDGAIAKFIGEGPGVAVVPVPAALPLLAFGLLGLGGVTMRRRKA